MAATTRHRPALDRTDDFRALVSERISSSSSSSSYPPAHAQGSGPTSMPANVVQAHRQWIRRAYTIRGHIVSLLAHLCSIRRPYLSLSSASSSSSSAAGAGTGASAGGMTDAQRDEADFQVKLVVKRCLDSIKELELAEQARKKTAPTEPTALSPLHTLLSLSTPRDSASSILASSLVSAHRASVVHYLSTLLSRASALQSDMQELRLRAQRERSRSLANSRAIAQSSSAVGASGASAGGQASSAAPTVVRGSVGGSFDPSLESESALVGQDISSRLTPAQIQLFEEESSQLVKALESDLAAIKKAESRLYEISELQTQVAQQLEQQGEVTERLLDEAIGVGTEVGRGNEQLEQARKRSREADKMLSVFLVGSGLALLFLHWMD